jgi:hypothetical protein
VASGEKTKNSDEWRLASQGTLTQS